MLFRSGEELAFHQEAVADRGGTGAGDGGAAAGADHAGNLGCFHVLAIINSAAMNIGEHVSLSILVSLVCMPSSGIAGS